MISDGNFRKAEHILKSKDFRGVYRSGVWAKKNAVVLYSLPNALGHNRIGFSIGSRYVKLATSRNRIKRLFREIFRKRKKSLKTAFDIVVVVRKGFGKDIKHAEIEDLFLGLLKRIGIMA